MWKPIAMGLSMLGLGLAGLFQDPPPRGGDGPPPPKAKAKGKKGKPGDELRKTYDLLRRVRSDTSGGRAQERIKDWTDRATDLYRKAIQAKEQGEPSRAREIGTAAHDLARAADHALNAARLDRPDPDLPPPPDELGPDDVNERTRRDLFRAYERIRSAEAYRADADIRFYLNAARDLYSAARRDAEAGRDERAGELARAAEAITHVPEHLAHAAVGSAPGPDGRDAFAPRPPDAKKKDRGPGRDPFDPPPAPKGEPFGPRERGLPPPLN